MNQNRDLIQEFLKIEKSLEKIKKEQNPVDNKIRNEKKDPTSDKEIF